MEVSSLCKCRLPLMACSVFINCISPLSEVKLYLSNFRENVTKISIWFAGGATINLVRINTDICLFLCKQQRGRAVLHNPHYCAGTARARFKKIFDQIKAHSRINSFQKQIFCSIQYDKQRCLVYIFKCLSAQTLKGVDGASSKKVLIIMFH